MVHKHKRSGAEYNFQQTFCNSANNISPIDHQVGTDFAIVFLGNNESKLVHAIHWSSRKEYVIRNMT